MKQRTSHSKQNPLVCFGVSSYSHPSYAEKPISIDDARHPRRFTQ